MHRFFVFSAHGMPLPGINRDNNMLCLKLSSELIGNRQVMKNLWNDEAGVILSAEIVLIGTILVLGMIVGLVELQCAVVGELSDLGDAFGNLDQSYQTSSVTSSKSTYGFKAATYGASYNDQQDECDCNAIIVCATNKGEKDI
jgi:Flp pilus assembly pilin Flp